MDDVRLNEYLSVFFLWRSCVLLVTAWDVSEVNDILKHSIVRDELKKVIQFLQEWLDGL